MTNLDTILLGLLGASGLASSGLLYAILLCLQRQSHVEPERYDLPSNTRALLAVAPEEPFAPIPVPQASQAPQVQQGPVRVGIWLGEHLCHITTSGSTEHLEYLSFGDTYTVKPIGGKDGY